MMWAVRVRVFADHEQIDWFAAPPATAVVMIIDEFVGAPRLLLSLDPPRAKVVGDADGRLGAWFPSGGLLERNGRFRDPFDPCSVSADGRFLAGSTYLRGAHTTWEAPLHLADVDGRWITPIVPTTNGKRANLSREGLWIALQGLDDDLVHVGKLHVAWPPG